MNKYVEDVEINCRFTRGSKSEVCFVVLMSPNPSEVSVQVAFIVQRLLLQAAEEQCYSS